MPTGRSADKPASATPNARDGRYVPLVTCTIGANSSPAALVTASTIP
jgi:hypothetical protein